MLSHVCQKCSLHWNLQTVVCKDLCVCVCVCVCVKSMCVCLLSMSTNGCGPGGTSGVHTIILGMVQPELLGTSPPLGGFGSTGS